MSTRTRPTANATLTFGPHIFWCNRTSENDFGFGYTLDREGTDVLWNAQTSGDGLAAAMLLMHQASEFDFLPFTEIRFSCGKSMKVYRPEPENGSTTMRIGFSQKDGLVTDFVALSGPAYKALAACLGSMMGEAECTF